MAGVGRPGGAIQRRARLQLDGPAQERGASLGNVSGLEAAVGVARDGGNPGTAVRSGSGTSKKEIRRGSLQGVPCPPLFVPRYGRGTGRHPGSEPRSRPVTGGGWARGRQRPDPAGRAFLPHRKARRARRIHGCSARLRLPDSIRSVSEAHRQRLYRLQVYASGVRHGQRPGWVLPDHRILLGLQPGNRAPARAALGSGFELDAFARRAAVPPAFFLALCREPGLREHGQDLPQARASPGPSRNAGGAVERAAGDPPVRPRHRIPCSGMERASW